jgi:hypothetical protein
MDQDRSSMVAIVGAAISLLVLISLGLLPMLSGDSPEDYFPLVVLALLGAAGFLGWIVIGRATRSRTWLVLLAIVAAWGILLGSATTLGSYNDYSFYSSQLISARETTERARTDRGKDDLGPSLETVERLRADELRTQQSASRAKSGLILSIAVLAIGLAVAAKVAMLVRNRPQES